jgi:hypothetical protein
MSKSEVLAKCDMVLSISENTVNYQFQELCKRGIIHKDWNIMVLEDDNGHVSKVLMNQSDKDFQAQLDKQLFSYAFKATLASPTISILQNEPKVLTFLVSFSTGTMYYWVGHGPSSHLKKVDMKGWTYGFKVQIGSIEKDAKDVKWITPESESSFKKNSNDSGLSQDLFSIESLFLDFENANYTEYDKSKSNIPTDIQEVAIFQNLLSNYFTTLTKTDNPYILGYGMKLKTIQEHAQFNPSALRYSTSYNDAPSLRAFNFLMMIDGNNFPDGEDVGVLPNSLITTEDMTESGVLAIDYDIFEMKILKPFTDAIEHGLTSGFKNNTWNHNGQEWSISNSISVTKDTDVDPSDFFQTTHIDSVFDLKSTIKLTDKNATSLLLQTLADYDLNIKVRPWELIHGGRHTDYEYWYSTEGQIDVGPNKHMGQQGKIDITFELGNEGKMQINDTITHPYLGVSKKPVDKGGMGVNEAYWKFDSDNKAATDSMKAFNNISQSFISIKDGLDTAMKGINSGKVILPLGRIYAYKDIQLHSKKSQAGHWARCNPLNCITKEIDRF